MTAPSAERRAREAGFLPPGVLGCCAFPHLRCPPASVSPLHPRVSGRDSPLPTTSCGVRTSFLIMLQIPARNDGKEGRAERGRWRSPGLGGVGTGTATLWVMPSAQLCARRGCLCHADVTETASAVCLRAVPRRRHRSVSVTARQVHPSSPSPYAHCNEPTIWPSIFDMLLLCLQ